MANPLVHLPRPGPGGGDHEPENQDPPWDIPPVEQDEGTARRRKRGFTARAADEDAEAARRRSDDTFAVVREADASEHRQSAWDWGDTRTWLILFAMFFGFLAFVALVYFMPYGRHNQDDGPTPTPSIRVY